MSAAAEDINAYWMPFTANRDFKAEPRIIKGAERHHYIREDGTKIVMTTHDLGQARRMADEVLFLHRGRLLEQTPAADFFESPASTEAQTFLRGELLW